VADVPRRPWRTLLRVVLSLAALAWVLSRVDLAEARAQLAGLPAWAWLAPTVIYTLNSGLHGLRVRVLMAALGPAPSAAAMWALMLRSAFAGAFLPSGGAELAKVGLLARASGSTEAALASILMARLLELVPWTLLLLWGLRWGIGAHDPVVGLAALVFALAFGAVLLGSLLLARHGLPPPALLRRLPAPLEALARRTHRALGLLSHAPRALLASLLLSLPFSLLNCLTAWLVMRAHGLPVGYLDTLAIIPAVDTLISLPISINGVGVREGLMVGLLAPWGAGEAVAVAVAWTRWTGELGRATLGGLLVLVGGAGARSEAS
jgi:glycosyltransferase 2 family protein